MWCCKLVFSLFPGEKRTLAPQSLHHTFKTKCVLIIVSLFCVQNTQLFHFLRSSKDLVAYRQEQDTLNLSYQGRKKYSSIQK